MTTLETIAAFGIILIALPLMLLVGRLTRIGNALARIAAAADRHLFMELAREQEREELVRGLREDLRDVREGDDD